MPEMANKANIFFLDSGPAVRQRSTQTSVIFCTSSCSAMFTQAISSSLAFRSNVGLGGASGFSGVVDDPGRDEGSGADTLWKQL